MTVPNETQDNASPPAIELQDVTVRFEDKTVLDNFSLRVMPGEKVTLVGPPGCGKTTVLRCVLGFVVPDAGRVLIDGQQLTPQTVWLLRRKVAYVAQDAELGPGSVREAVERPFRFRANAHLRDNLSRLPQLMERFGLSPELLDQETSTLSGGQRQLFALISALLLDRPVMLLDEPTANLDDSTARQVAAYFRERDDLTVLAVTHHRERFDVGARVVRLAEGVPVDDAR